MGLVVAFVLLFRSWSGEVDTVDFTNNRIDANRHRSGLRWTSGGWCRSATVLAAEFCPILVGHSGNLELIAEMMQGDLW